MDRRKIIQIIPADGWVALYNWNGEVVRDPVMCFALVEDEEGGQDVQPMEYADNYADFCDESENFISIDREHTGPQRSRDEVKQDMMEMFVAGAGWVVNAHGDPSNNEQLTQASNAALYVIEAARRNGKTIPEFLAEMMERIPGRQDDESKPEP